MLHVFGPENVERVVEVGKKLDGLDEIDFGSLKVVLA